MTKNISRKEFLKFSGSVLALSSIGFPNIILPKKRDKIGVTLVGLGSYSNGRLGPGLKLTQHCELRGIVTGTPSKIPIWQEEYGIPDRNVYNYETMHEVANNDDIDVIYVVTPPALHAKYSIIGANAGKHVWCEKPMAMDVEECQAIIDSANKNRVQLTIGYRMQYEPNTQTIIRYGAERTYGDFVEVRTGAGYNGAHRDPENWRRIGHMGGGALYDMGVYAINGARYATGMDPVRVRGRQWSERTVMYSDVDEFTEFDMEFANGLMAFGETAFGKSSNYLDVECTGGSYRLSPMQSYSGVQGETSDGIQLPPDPNHQQARQMDNDALAILENSNPIAPGEDGLMDIRIVNAIMASSKKDGAWITL